MYDFKKMEEILEKLFESIAKARILRLFMQNPEDSFSISEISERTQLNPSRVRSEINKLIKIDIVKSRLSHTKQTNTKQISKRHNAYLINKNFPLYRELRELVINSSIASRKKLIDRVKRIGRIRLVVLAGIFLRNDNARIDLLIVGDDISRAKLKHFLANLESELGTALRYAVMSTDEFQYRRNMYDRFLRDILEFPHEKLINRLGI